MVIVAPAKKQHLSVRRQLAVAAIAFLAAVSVWIFMSSMKLRTESTKLRVKGVRNIEVKENGKMHLSAAQMLKSGRPYLIYGTAWKKDETSAYVSKALHSGFRFIDTACQPKHYDEAGVGVGWKEAAADLGLERSDIFLQTKFTSVNGQDPNNIPYDKTAPLEEQVKQSLERSLKNLQTDYIDSLLLHSPMKSMEDTLRVWKVFETFVSDGRVRQIGVSNMYNYRDLRTLHREASVKPMVLQNRFHDQTKYDVKLREICNAFGMTYQSFWTLTAPSNRKAMGSRTWTTIAQEKQLTPQTLMYAYMMSLRHTPLDGSKNINHMKEDVELFTRFQNGEQILTDDEVNMLSSSLGIQ